MEDVGEEREASSRVRGPTVEEGWSCSSSWRDERRRRIREGNDKGRMRAVVQCRGVGEVVDGQMTTVVEVDVKLACKVPPELGEVGGEHDEEVGALLHVAVEALRAELWWEACEGEVGQRVVPALVQPTAYSCSRVQRGRGGRRRVCRGRAAEVAPLSTS